MRSEWPFRYLVGGVHHEVGAVLDRPRQHRRGHGRIDRDARAGARARAAAVAAMSVMVQSGLAGVSIQTSRVLPGRSAAATAAGSVMSISSTCRPQWVAKFISQLRSDQYITFGASTWSPGRERLEHGGGRGHARREQRRLRALLEPRDHRFGLVERRVVGARIDAARAVLVVGVAQVGRRDVERRRDRARRLVDPAQRLGGNALGSAPFRDVHQWVLVVPTESSTCTRYTASAAARQPPGEVDPS